MTSTTRPIPIRTVPRAAVEALVARLAVNLPASQLARR